MIPYNQLSLADIFSDCQEIYESDKPQFLSLLQQHIDLDEIIPASFRKHFYASTGRTRKYPLHAFLWALIIQRIFSVPTGSLLLVFLLYSRHLREFCGFDKVPDASKITRFKQDFLEDIQAVFERLVDLTEPIRQAIDSCKADMTIFDSSGIEAWVTENNPKYANRIIKQLKAYAKAMHFDDSYDPYKAAYGSMPSHSAASSDIKQLCIDGHFCYAYKIRTTVERSINQFKDSFRLAGRKTQNEKTLHADLLLAGITQLIGVILADKIKQHQYIRSLKPLIA